MESVDFRYLKTECFLVWGWKADSAAGMSELTFDEWKKSSKSGWLCCQGKADRLQWGNKKDHFLKVVIWTKRWTGCLLGIVCVHAVADVELGVRRWQMEGDREKRKVANNQFNFLHRFAWNQLNMHILSWKSHALNKKEKQNCCIVTFCYLVQERGKKIPCRQVGVPKIGRHTYFCQIQ